MRLEYDARALGNRIKELRKAKKMTQAQLAVVFHVCEDTIRGYENGKTSINHELLVQLSTYFHVSMDYLYFGKASITSDNYDVGRIISLLEGCSDKDKHKALNLLQLVFDEK